MIRTATEPVPGNGWCPLCTGRLELYWAAVAIVDSSERRDFWACADCGSYWTHVPPHVRSESYYTSKPESDHELLEEGAARFRRVRAAVERTLGRRTYSILDVGCARGAHLSVYPATVRKAGIEPSLAARPYLAQRGIAWLGSQVRDVPPRETFDVVTCLDVLEHVEHPGAMLDAIDRVLRPGGVVVIVTGNIDSFSARLSQRRWLYYALPEHCSFPSPFALRKQLTGRMGYVIRHETWAANEDVSARYVLRFGYGVARELSWRLWRSHAPIGDRDATFPFFADSNLLLVAQKTRSL